VPKWHLSAHGGMAAAMAYVDRLSDEDAYQRLRRVDMDTPFLDSFLFGFVMGVVCTLVYIAWRQTRPDKIMGLPPRNKRLPGLED
jgi:hypothetical protein